MCSLPPILGSPAAAQQPDPAFLKDVHRLLELTGALKMGQQMASMVAAQVMEAVGAGRAAVPPRASQLVKEIVDDEFRKAFAPGGGMAEGIAGIYARYFTLEEIRGLIAFYETPLGSKVTETLPAIAQESMKVGIAWAGKQMPAVQKRIEDTLRAEGLIRTP
jgi:hypothetical protein